MGGHYHGSSAPGRRMRPRLPRCMLVAVGAASIKGVPAPAHPSPLPKPRSSAWSQKEKLDAHPLFQAMLEEEVERDPAAALLLQGTEEGQKVARNGGKTWRAVYRRVEDA